MLASDFDEAAACVEADPFDRVLFDRLGRERTHVKTVERVNRLALFASTRRPVTIRQGYYHLDVHGLIAKTDAGYGVVVEPMNEMVDAGIIDADWIVDLSREPLIWRGYDSPAHALRVAAESYYKNLWLHEPHHIMIWIEKQGLIETIRGPCVRRCVSVWPARGYASRSFLRRAVKEIVAAGKPTFVYAFGDYDAAGWFASQHIDDMLRDYAELANFKHPIAFERVALSAQDIIEHNLPTRASKEIDDRGRPIASAPAFRLLQEEMLGDGWPELIGQSCELDALDPAVLRGMVEDCARRHLSDAHLAELEAQEAAEKAEIMRIVRRLERRS
jgi:hypothetical protein